MKNVFLVLFITFGYLLNAQTFTEDFENVSQSCSNINIFNGGCVADWIATHGSANISNEYNDNNQIVNSYASMVASNTSCNNGNTRSEGIALEYDFLPGISYSLTFRAKVENASLPIFEVSLANGLVNDVSAYGLECPPNVSSIVDVIQLDGNSAGFGSTWHEYSIAITELDECYTQLWFRPEFSGGSSVFAIDDVEISAPESDLFSSQFVWNSGDLCTYWVEAIDLPNNASYQWYHTGGATVANPNNSGTMVTIPSGQTLEICLEVGFDNNSDCTVMECSKLSCPIICEAPSGLQVSSQNSTYFSTLVDWDDVSSPYQYYEIQFENVNTGQGGVYNTTQSKKRFNKLRACTEYRVRVRTQCLTPGSTSVWSNWVHFNTYCVEVCWETDNCAFATINGELIMNCTYHLYFTPNSDANVSVDINAGVTFEAADGSISDAISESLIDEDFDNGITSIEHSLQLSVNPLSPYWVPHEVCITVDYPNGQTEDVCLAGTDSSWRCMFGSYEIGKSLNVKKRNDESVTNWGELIKDTSQPINANIYPNPVTDDLWISLDNKDASDYSIQVFNTLGELIITEEVINPQNDIQIQTKGLISGFYIINISDNKGGMISKKIIKK